MNNRKTQLIVFGSGLFLFLVIFGLSVLLQSPIMLYIASAIPIFVVPFLPDLRTNQTLKPGTPGVEIVQLDGKGDPSSELLIVSFTPGRIYWNKKYVYIPLDAVKTVAGVRSGEYTAAVTILRHDLKFNAKKNRIGVNLPNLLERLRNMPYTTNEVNRFILRMEDVRDAIMPISMHTLSGKMSMHT